MGTLINTNNVIQELYVGETEFISRLIEEVSKAREPYVGKMKKPIKGNKDFIKIGDMIAEEFGFYAVTFIVPYDTSMNAFTYPITMNIDDSITEKKPKFLNGKGLYYNPEVGKLCIIVAVTAGCWFNPDFSDREIVASILHEIGHSFVTQSKRMIDIVETNRLTIAYTVVYQMILKIYIAMINPKILLTLPADIKNIMKSSNKGKEIINAVSKELANNPWFKPFNSISAITEWIYNVFLNICKEIFTIFGFAIKLIALPGHIVNRILAPLNKEAYAVSRSQEYLSDSFAAMYGLGPEISSFLTKIEYSPKASGSQIERALSSIPIIGVIHESLNIPILLIINSITTHPSTPARINKILEELNKELKDSDLSPKTKQAVKRNIKDLEKVRDEFISTDKKKLNAEMVKRMWMSFINSKGEFSNDLEDYYTDLDLRDKYVKEMAKLMEEEKE